LRTAWLCLRPQILPFVFQCSDSHA
jgi:hypothetical protein